MSSSAVAVEFSTVAVKDSLFSMESSIHNLIMSSDLIESFCEEDFFKTALVQLVLVTVFAWLVPLQTRAVRALPLLASPKIFRIV